jgi:bifunctional UDP-N-acetylglucosamine pyrophosphorylase/glucosamine-1-phosphate N-acetyltransferase
MGYGRIMRDGETVVGIIEQKDASAEQLKINEVNSGILVANGADFQHWLSLLDNNNAQAEYYLTDVIALAHKAGRKINAVHPIANIEVEGVNNRMQLAELERAYQELQAYKLMEQGVTMLDPRRFDLRGEVIVGNDVTFDINVIIEGKVTIGSGVTIGANCILKDCHIGANSEIKPNSIIESAIIGVDCSAGPFARLRPGTILEDDAHVGNFVELKKTTLGKGSKAGHLAYLGDSTIGEQVNIGAGTITCNYDGVNKFKTIIEDGAFIGSDSQLIAPVTIGKNATVGAGSTIAKDVAADELVITRVKQRHIKNWSKPTKISK